VSAQPGGFTSNKQPWLSKQNEWRSSEMNDDGDAVYTIIPLKDERWSTFVEPHPKANASMFRRLLYLNAG